MPQGNITDELPSANVTLPMLNDTTVSAAWCCCAPARAHTAQPVRCKAGPPPQGRAAC
jgi:hypothetical protein